MILMFVRWQHRWHTLQSRWEDYPDVHWSAILVESKRISGKPKQRHVAYLAGFTEGEIRGRSGSAVRCRVWDEVSAHLDLFGDRITAANREKIEAAIAMKVPRPTPTAYRANARKAAALLGWEWLRKKQRTALKDEAEQWQQGETHEAEVTS